MGIVKAAVRSPLNRATPSSPATDVSIRITVTHRLNVIPSPRLHRPILAVSSISRKWRALSGFRSKNAHCIPPIYVDCSVLNPQICRFAHVCWGLIALSTPASKWPASDRPAYARDKYGKTDISGKTINPFCFETPLSGKPSIAAQWIIGSVLWRG